MTKASKDIELLTRAEQMLAEVQTIEQAANLVDLAAAARDMAMRAHLGEAAMNRAQAIKVKAYARLAELVDEGQARGQIATPGGDRQTIVRDAVNGPEPLPIPRQRLAEARTIRANFTDTQIDEVFDAATDVVPLSRFISKAKKGNREAKRVAEDIERLQIVQAGTNIDLRLGDFRTALADLKPVDAIITDPPYPREFLPLLGDLAEYAQGALKPTGVLAVMIGQSYLPDVYRLLDGRLPYLWTIAYLTPGGQAVQIWDRKVNTFWKPVLVYGHAAEWFGDVAKSDTNDNDKEHHHWGQSVSGMLDLVKRLTKPGAHIVDPFMGAGTTGVAATANGCHFTGCDIDSASLATAQKRLAS